MLGINIKIISFILFILLLFIIIYIYFNNNNTTSDIIKTGGKEENLENYNPFLPTQPYSNPTPKGVGWLGGLILDRDSSLLNTSNLIEQKESMGWRDRVYKVIWGNKKEIIWKNKYNPIPLSLWDRGLREEKYKSPIITPTLWVGGVWGNEKE